MIFQYFLLSFIGFVSGSIMYSYIIPKFLFKADITKISKDGNPGCGNVFTEIGIPCGILCLLLELTKGALPVWLASASLDTTKPLFALILAAPVAGHAFSPMLMRKGGKAIAVSFGVFIGIFPKMMTLLWLAIPFVFFSVIIRICPHSLRVMTSFISMFFITLFMERSPTASLAAAIISFIVIYKHYSDYTQREKIQAEIYIFTHCLYHRDIIGDTDK